MKLRSGKIINSTLSRSDVNKKYRHNKSCIHELITFSIISCSIILLAIISSQHDLWNNIEFYNTISPFTTFDITNITSQEIIPKSLYSNFFENF